MDYHLGDKVALVTGGGSQIGLGKAIALTLAREGCDVIVSDIDLAGAEKTAAAIKTLGRKAIAVKADITSSTQMKAAVKKGLEEFGKIDILVNNAGSASKPRVFFEHTEEELDFEVDVLLKGAIKCTKAVIDHMIARRSGKIINVSSIVGIYPQGVLAVYSAAKAGIVAFTRALAYEVAPLGINVNGVAPGFVKTGFAGGPPPGMDEIEKKETPVGRLTVPQDIANTVAFFASDVSGDIVGETIVVSGGRR